MLEVKVEIVPFGDESKRRLLDRLLIINTGEHKDSPKKGNYICHHRDGSFEIRNHVRDVGYWSLVRKCLKKLLY